MLQRFSKEGETAGAGTIEGAEDIVLRIRGVRGVRSVSGEEKRKHQKTQDYIGTKCPQPMGTMSQNTQPIKHSPSNTDH